MSRLRVAIDARLATGTWGGIEQVIIGLASGLSALDDGDEEYHFLAYADSTAWIEPYLRGNCRLLLEPPMPVQLRLLQSRIIKPILPVARNVWYRLQSFAGHRALPTSSGTAERAHIDVIHFTIQSAFHTEIPSIYHPHDLQHIHLPQFFTPQQRRFREFSYQAFCDQATLVAVTSSWGKQDLIAHYHLAPEKVQVIPWAPVIGAYPDSSDEQLRLVQQRYDLPSEFVFYPAQTWPHKNHLGLLDALALLRERHGLNIPFVSSGQRNEFFPQIQRRVEELGLGQSVQFLGFVSPADLRCLYQLCRAVVIPTRFEAGSFPLWEAFLAGAPAACSNVTSLPRQAGNGALVFDPDDVESIAAAVMRLWVDDPLRQDLVKRAAAIVSQFTWDRTARMFRAHYRRIAGRMLTSEDTALLSAEPLL